MRNKKFWVWLVLGAFFVTYTGAVQAYTNDDYKVIKNAVKKSKAKNSDVMYFRILVKDAKTEKTKVRIRLPLSLIEFFVDTLDENVSISRYGKKINFKTVMQLIRENGPQTLIEVTEEDHIVKIWIE